MRLLVCLACAFLTQPLSFPAAQIIEANTEDICIADQERALNVALKHHQTISERIASLKGLNNEALERALWSIQSFKEALPKYLEAVEQSSLVLFDADTKQICAFLWQRGDQKPLYSRTTLTVKELNNIIDRTRRATALNFPRNDRAAEERAIMLLEAESDLSGNKQKVKPENAEAKIEEDKVKLSEILFPPKFREALRRTQHLTIVPIGAMTLAPLGILRPLGTTELVIDRFSINYLLFAGEVSAPTWTWEGKFDNPLVFANPTPDADINTKFGRIPATELEAKNLQKLIGAKPDRILLREKATIAAYNSEAGNSDLLYFATHGWTDPRMTETDALAKSFILLNRPLSARDARISLPAAKLVVMSACQTGLGYVVDAGVIGLARSFLDAGAHNVVMSLWNISDDGTRQIMEYFAENLRIRAPADAMRLAQLSMRSHPAYNFPAYWAAFSIYGNHAK